MIDDMEIKSDKRQNQLRETINDLLLSETLPECKPAGSVEDLLELQDNDEKTIQSAVNRLNTYGHTNLCTAAFIGSSKCCQVLISVGADVNQADTDGWTPLHYAVAQNHWDVAKFLVSSGGDINTVNKEGDTPLDYVEDDDARQKLIGSLCMYRSPSVSV